MLLSSQEFRPCDVCRLVDYDCTPKFCAYCPRCDAWICMADQSRWDRRLVAALKRKLEPGYRGEPDYVETETRNLKGTT